MSKRWARVRASYILYLCNGRPLEQSRLITQTPLCKSTVSRWNGDKGYAVTYAGERGRLFECLTLSRVTGTYVREVEFRVLSELPPPPSQPPRNNVHGFLRLQTITNTRGTQSLWI